MLYGALARELREEGPGAMVRPTRLLHVTQHSIPEGRWAGCGRRSRSRRMPTDRDAR